MSLKGIVARQYRELVDQAEPQLRHLQVPREGWIATVRKALGMSGAQLARRLGLTRARVSQMENAESRGSVTLKSMQAAAEAMNCRFVYAIIPASGSMDTLLTDHARKKAEALVKRASQHMALENQALRQESHNQEIDRLTKELLENPPADFWEKP